MKQKITLTEQELTAIVKHSICEALNEIDGATYARIHNSTMAAQQRQLDGTPSTNPRRTNVDTIIKGISLDPKAADSLISPYKTDYLFHCQNLRGAAALTVFELEQLYLLNEDKAILKGKITFNNERLYGSIVIDMRTRRTYYNYKGQRPEYTLQIDPSKKQIWDGLVNQLDLAISNRNK